jgi:hypothetical protein
MTIPDDAAHNLLRPETVEGLYYLWYYSGDPKYRGRFGGYNVLSGCPFCCF